MTLNAGQAPTAATMLHLQPTIYSAAQTGNGGGLQAVTTTETDCLGCSVTFSTATAAAYMVVAFFDLDVTASGATTAVGRLNIDGTTVTGIEAHLGGSSVTRATPGQVWTGSLSGGGSHTLKLRIIKSAALATINCIDLHTRMAITVIEVV
jgi:hypothetical protein